MILSKKYSIMIGVGLALALTVGCGSGASDDTKNAGGDTIRDGHAVGSQFTDVERNNKTAGIRCVSTVQ